MFGVVLVLIHPLFEGAYGFAVDGSGVAEGSEVLKIALRLAGMSGAGASADVRDEDFQGLRLFAPAGGIGFKAGRGHDAFAAEEVEVEAAGFAMLIKIGAAHAFDI